MIPDDPTGRWHLDDLQQESRRLVLGPRGSRDSRGRGKFVAVNLFTGRTTSGYPLPCSSSLKTLTNRITNVNLFSGSLG